MKKATVATIVIILSGIFLVSAAAYEFIPSVKRMFVSEHADIPAFIDSSMDIRKEGSIDKLKALSAVGFTSANSKIKNIENRKLTDSVFSGYKYISDEVLGRLLEKFKLAYSVVSDFTCPVPDENLKEIEAFRTKHPVVEKVVEINPYDVNISLNTLRQARVDGKVKFFITNKNQFLIVATSTCFTRTQGGFTPDGKMVVKDPIVLYPVDGGHIIVTSW